jgi:hypothetical protein
MRSLFIRSFFIHLQNLYGHFLYSQILYGSKFIQYNSGYSEGYGTYLLVPLIAFKYKVRYPRNCLAGKSSSRVENKKYFFFYLSTGTGI